jgi:Transposase and inactivated derivatives
MKKQTSATTETQIKGRKIIDYSGKTIYVGIDMHQKDWQVAKRLDGMTVGNHRMTGKSGELIGHLNRHYPGASFKCVYEACAWGFNLQRALRSAGMECIITHAADVPLTNKERASKTDKVDARRLAEHLENGSLKPIYVPDEKLQKHRSLSRLRKQFVKKLTRARNQLKSALKFHGIDIPEKFGKCCWSYNFMNWIEYQAMSDELLKDTLLFSLEEVKFLRQTLLQIERKLREMMHKENYSVQNKLAISVPGIGPITASQFLLEIGDIRRFENFDRLNSYIGLCPGSHDSGETQKSTGITARRHNQLRTAMVEAAWTAVRTDPAMQQAYRQLTKRMEPEKAIIRIARKLLRRLRTVLLTGVEYQKGIVY